MCTKDDSDELYLNEECEQNKYIIWEPSNSGSGNKSGVSFSLSIVLIKYYELVVSSSDHFEFFFCQKLNVFKFIRLIKAASRRLFAQCKISLHS